MPGDKSARLVFRKVYVTPYKTFIASVHRVRDDWGSRYEVSFTQTTCHEVEKKMDAVLEAARLINAAKDAYLASSGDE